MAGKTLSYFNLTGGLNTVQTMATINATPNRTESPDMVNIEYFKLSGIRTMNGNVGLNSSNAINDDYNTNRINFGYEYIKGNNRYMIVADMQSLYEYNPFTDTFTTLISFETAGDGITMCGYANGVIAASPVNNYLIYYKKGRSEEVTWGTITLDSTSTTATITTTYIDALGKGDILIVNDKELEIDEVVDNTTVKFTERPVDTGTFDFVLSDFTKIYCVYKSVVDNGDNTTSTTITNFMPKVVQSHQGRIWVGARIENETTAAYLIYSDLGNIHNAFVGGDASAYDAGHFAEFWEDTSDITAIGTWDKYIVCHKSEHTYLIDTSNSDATQWNVQSYSEYTCDNQKGFVKANNGYYTYCSTVGGIYPMIQRTIYSAISQGSEASTKIRDIFDNINTYALDQIFAVYHPNKKYIMFYMPMIGEEGSNNCYILDLQTKSWLHRKVPQFVTTAFEFDNKVYIGTRYGKIFEEFRGVTFDGEPVRFSWKSPWFIWGGATNWTTTREFRVKMSQEGTNNFYIRNRRDGIEDYKQRTITNTSNQVQSLMWDAAVLTDDRNPDYREQYGIYSYTGESGQTFYAFEDTLTETTPIYEYTGNIPDYVEVTLQGAIAAGAASYEDTGTSGDYDYADWSVGTRFAFKYTPTIPEYLCYQSTKDPNIKAWVDRNNTSEAIVNVEDKVGTDYYCITDEHSNYWYITKDDYDAYWNVKNKSIKAYSYNSSSNTMNHKLNNFYLWVYTNECKYANYSQGGRYFFAQYTDNTIIRLNSYLKRSIDRDKHIDDKTVEVWNGQDTMSGKTKVVSSYSDTSIVIEGVTYNRYTAGDEGSIIDTDNIVIVYSDTEKLSVGQTVYNDTALTDAYGNVTAISGDNYNIEGRIFEPSSSDNATDNNTVYYKIKPEFPSIGTITYTGTYTGNFIVRPVPYWEVNGESNHYSDDARFLTDSKWADGRDDATDIDSSLTEIETTGGNTWVNTGQITKRFLIDRQYFQTLQIEFCGETEDQGIELYGFEVDGIQLTEVPW